MPHGNNASDTARLFVALNVPRQVHEPLRLAIKRYPQYIEQILPSNRWHLTLCWLGEVKDYQQYVAALTQPLPQTFVPAVNITHVGRGLRRRHLWAWAAATPALQGLRQQLLARLKDIDFPLPSHERKRDFVPHIHLSNLYQDQAMLRIGLPDSMARATFSARQAYIYRSEVVEGGSRQYTVEGIIPLTS